MKSYASLAVGCIPRFAQWVCLALGAIACAGYATALIAGELGRRADVDAFSAAQPDVSLWSEQRVQQFRASLQAQVNKPIAVLRVPSLALAVPLYAELNELHLNRGVALIEGMSVPDRGGNVGIAGHRDGFFRVLKDIRRDDTIELQTYASTHRYRVVSVSIVDESDRHLLEDTEEPTLTLVTCFPFYRVGHAPQRFIVRGEYLWSESQSIVRP
jgi:sortase A